MINNFLNTLVLLAIFAAQVLAPAGVGAQIETVRAPLLDLRGVQTIPTSQPPGTLPIGGGETRTGGTFDSSLPVRPVVGFDRPTAPQPAGQAPQEGGFFDTILDFFRSGADTAQEAVEEVLGEYRATISNTRPQTLDETTVEFGEGAVIDEDSIKAPLGTTVIVVENTVTILDLPIGESVVVDIKDPGRATFSSGEVTGPVKLIKPQEKQVVRRDLTEAVHDTRLSDGAGENLVEGLTGLGTTLDIPTPAEIAKKKAECEDTINRFKELLAELKKVAEELKKEFGPLANAFSDMAAAFDKVSRGLGEGDGAPTDWKAVDEALAKAEQFFADAAEWTQTTSQPSALANAVSKLVDTVKDLRNADNSGYAKDAADFGKAVDGLKQTLGEFGSEETKAADAELTAAMSRLADNLKKLAGTDCPLPTVAIGFPGEITDRGGTVVGQKEDLTGPKGDFDELAGKIKQRGGGDASITVPVKGPGEESFEIKETAGLDGKIIFVDIKYYANENDKRDGKPLAKGFGSEKEGARNDAPNERERLGQFGGVGYRIRLDGYWRPGSEGAIELVLNKMEKALRQKLAGLLGGIDETELDVDALPTGAIDELKAKQKPCDPADFKKKFGLGISDLLNDKTKLEEFKDGLDPIQAIMVEGLINFRNQPIDPSVAAARNVLVDHLISAVTLCDFDLSLVDAIWGISRAGAIAAGVGVREQLENFGKLMSDLSLAWNAGDDADKDLAEEKAFEYAATIKNEIDKAVKEFIRFLKDTGELQNADYDDLTTRIARERASRGF